MALDALEVAGVREHEVEPKRHAWASFERRPAAGPDIELRCDRAFSTVGLELDTAALTTCGEITSTKPLFDFSTPRAFPNVCDRAGGDVAQRQSTAATRAYVAIGQEVEVDGGGKAMGCSRNI